MDPDTPHWPRVSRCPAGLPATDGLNLSFRAFQSRALAKGPRVKGASFVYSVFPPKEPDRIEFRQEIGRQQVPRASEISRLSAPHAGALPHGSRSPAAVNIN
ncbi:hypothetical protein P4O66_006991 [Electrophorus voltai]|uniref:Uncharacterized protein n=1 Tax=Electrophorus voltai TaxID=2609070 RepID=A0AAD9DZJ3_9TELE|nr:hypothetical protein P4O66_006991 [Electrophorus voltai]